MSATYNISPSPTQGNGAYGLVPGQVSAPASIYDQLNSNIPGYGGLTSTATGDIQSELSGTLSPETMSAIRDYSAASGAALGQPGDSGLATLIGMRTTGNTSEGLQQQGFNNFNTFTGTAGSQQQSPFLMADIAGENAATDAAPNPASAASYALQLYQQYMNPAGGSTFRYNPAGNMSGGNAVGTGGIYGDFSDANGGGSANYARLVAGNAG